MKKLLLFVIACTLGLFGTVRAHETITIGGDSELCSYSVPYTGENALQLTFAVAGEGSEELASEFSFDFENATLDGWRVFQDAGATSNNWEIGSGSYYGGVNDSYCVYSITYGTSSLVAKNYIVTTEAYAITSESVLSWWIKHTYPGYESCDKYAVVVSTDGENFEQIADYTAEVGVTKEISLAAYAGQNLYLGFYHHGQGGDAICLDNIALTAGEGGEEGGEGEDPEIPVDPENLCTLVLDLVDSYGDGWNGNSLVVEYGSTSESFTVSNGKTASYTLDVPQGSEVTITYQLGAGSTYPSENSFVVKYESGKEIVSATQGSLSSTVVYGPYTIDCAPQAPELPVVVAKATGETTIELTFSAVGAETYTVYQGTEVLVEDFTETTYLVEGLTANTPYCFSVKAFNEVGESDLSEACATTYTEGTVIVEIGEGTTIGYYAPICDQGNYSSYSLSQQIYLQEELNSEPCAITNVSFHNAYGGPNTRNIVVYMTNTNKDSFTSGSDWVEVSEADIVYQGEHTFGANGEWTTIEFQAPFIYRGKNVCITVNDLTGVAKGYSGYDGFYATDISVYRGVYACGGTQYDCSNMASISGSILYNYNYSAAVYVPYIANVKFKTEVAEVETVEIPNAPANLVAEANGFSSVVLSWDAVEGAEKYNVYQDAVLFASNLNETTYTVTGLSDATEYCFTVTATNLGGESEASEPACATTEEFEGCLLYFTLKDQYGDGWSYDKLVVTVDGVSQDLYFELANMAIKEYSKIHVVPVASGATVNVKWQAGATSSWPAEESFVIEYANGDLISSANGTGTNDELEAFMAYDYTFVANCGGDTPVEPELPAAPANLVATADGMNSIVLTWDAVEGATDYYVYKDGQMWANTSGATTYTENGLAAGTECCFAVQTVAGDLESELSETVCATTESLPENQIIIGEAATADYVPFYTRYDGVWTEMIYKAEEIGKACAISELAFSYKSGNPTTADINIYLKEVTTTEFVETDVTLPESELTLVYSGAEVTLCDEAWETFVLNAPFAYSGENNLLVVVYTSNTESVFNKWNCYEDANSVLVNVTQAEYIFANSNKPVLKLTLAEGGDTPVEPAQEYRLESIKAPYAWNDVRYYYEGDKVVKIFKGDAEGNFAQGWSVEAVLLEYDENDVVTGYTQGYVYGYDETEVDATSEYRTVTYNYTDGNLSSYAETVYYTWRDPETSEYTVTTDAEGRVTELAYGTSKTVYEYENGKLVSETKSYYDQWAATPGYVTEYIIEYTYDENGNCTVATRYTTYDGEKTARQATEYQYNLTIAAENVTAFAYPQEVKPAHANLVTRTISYNFNEDYWTGETYKGDYSVSTYNYTPEVVAAPIAPMDLKAQVLSDTQIALSWASLVDGVTFTVYNGTEIIAENVTSTTYTVENLTAATEYCFTVVSVDGETVSGPSNEACATTKNLVDIEPKEIAFGDVRLGSEYWSESKTAVSVTVNTFGKTVKEVSVDNNFFRVPSNIDLTAETITLTVDYNKNAQAGEYEGSLTVTLDTDETVSIPLSATAYEAVEPDVFELATEVTFEEGVYTNTPDFATLHDDYNLPNEEQGVVLPDAAYVFTLEGDKEIEVNVTAENAIYAIYKAFGEEEGPTAENAYYGEDKPLATKFNYNFNDANLDNFTIEDNDAFENYTWKIEDGALVSYSFDSWGEWGVDYDYINQADERIITNEAYEIVANTVLTMDVNFNGSFESVIVEVTKDGETFTEVELVNDGSYSYEFLAKRVNIGAKFAELGLEYGEYRISLHHDVDGYGKISIDNLVLAERAYVYSAGTYYLIAAAEEAFSVEIALADVVVEEPTVPEAPYVEAEATGETTIVLTWEAVEGALSYNVYQGENTVATDLTSTTYTVEGLTPNTEYCYTVTAVNEAGESEPSEEVCAKTDRAPQVFDAEATYRLVSTENYSITTYEYVSENTTQVLGVEAEGLVDHMKYDEEGNLTGYVSCSSYENEEGNLVIDTLSVVDYKYENGILVGYTETSTSGWFGTQTFEYEYVYNEEGQLTAVQSAEMKTTYSYNEEGLVSEKLVGYVYGEGEEAELSIESKETYTYENGKLVRAGIYSLDWMNENEFLLVEEVVYTYDENGNCVLEETYSVEEDEEGNEVKYFYNAVEYTYNTTVSKDNVYTFEYPHLALAEPAQPAYENILVETLSYYGYYDEEIGETVKHTFVETAYYYEEYEEEQEVVVVPAPSNVVAEATSATTLTLSWDAVEGAIGYAIFNEGEYIGATDKTSVGFKDLKPETTYCFTVATVTEVDAEGYITGISEESEEACATTFEDGIAENASAFNIYPNPVNEKLFIETEATVEEVSIYTLTGVMIYSEVNFNDNTIDVSDFANGVYIMKVRTDNGEVVKRFVKK